MTPALSAVHHGSGSDREITAEQQWACMQHYREQRSQAQSLPVLAVWLLISAPIVHYYIVSHITELAKSL
jgi:hypothetical protein